VWVETPDEPDAERDRRHRRDRGGGRGRVAVDNTFATPVTSGRSSSAPAAVVHSTTKYLGGHSDAVGGAVVVRDRALHERVRFVQNAIGAVPGRSTASSCTAGCARCTCAWRRTRERLRR
jgi:cystathionine gamma-synthase